MDERWEQLKRDCAACGRCPLGATRRRLVFGVGREDAQLLFVGEGPGEQEDLQGEPFVGPAGKLLDTMLELIDLRRGDLYIANIVKCRPPHNRDPQADEQAACRPWLDRQIELLQPRLIVCLGRIAAQALIDPEFRITRQHGQLFERDGRFYLATYHPSALLRDPDRRPEAFEDLVVVRDWLREHCPGVFPAAGNP